VVRIYPKFQGRFNVLISADFSRYHEDCGTYSKLACMTSQNEFHYRVATETDAAGLVPLINRAFEVERQFFTSDRIDLPTTLEHLKKGNFLLAERNGKLAGCNYVELREDSGYFGLLSVDPSEQGRGLGRKLVEQAEGFCRDAGCRVMRIRVLNHRTELPPFYEKLGYRAAQIEEVEQVPTALVPYHFIIMEKPL
jgi:GNAT superfamily N-acetyltransferase